MRLTPIALLLALWLTLPALASAQTAPALVVTIRDEDGVGVAGVGVTVRDQAASQVLATGLTDAAGRATFAAVPAMTARVAVQGALPGGAPLHQRGDDAPGILVSLDPPPVSLDLRVEADGAVVPDPAMFALEASAPIPTAEVPASDERTAPAAETPITRDSDPPPALGGTGAVAGTGAGWLLGALAILIVVAGIGTVLMSERRVL